MSDVPGPYVFDAGPLSHFARATWLGLLRAYSKESGAVLPSPVRQEIADGVESHPELRQILDAHWLRQDDLGGIEMTTAFAGFAALLVPAGSRKNLGECSVLAVAQVSGGVAVIDDWEARQIADARGIKFKTTLAILADLVNSGHLSQEMASSVADALLETEYRLPMEAGGFRMWMIEQGIWTPPEV